MILSLGIAAQQQSVKQIDHQHDFDFNIGNWKTHLHRLINPLSGAKIWNDFEGTVTVQKVWNGRAQIEEIEANGSCGRFEALTLFLYDPQLHQWSMNFANGADGMMDQPGFGGFKNGRGEFYQMRSYHGRPVMVRMIWSAITLTSHRVEQSFSNDGGKTWEVNFIATLTKIIKQTKVITPRHSIRDFDLP